MIIYRTINGVKFGVDPHKAAGLLCTADAAAAIDGDVYEFIEYLYEKRKKYTPMVATWEITNCCNFKCPFCYINTPAKPIAKVQTFESMKSYIDDLVDMGLLLVYLTGGEVLSVPDFPRIYTYLKNKGVFVVLLSNLSLLTEEHLELFRNYPPMRVTVSVYGMDEAQFTSVTGTDFSKCDVILNNILTLKQMGINVTCQMPVNKYTVNDLIQIAEWCYLHNIRFTYNNELTDSYYNESRSSEYINDLAFDELRKQIRQVETVKSSKTTPVERKFGYKHHFDCISGRHTFAVSYDAHLRPCFNIWESDCKAFDGTDSMRSAMISMIAYIEQMNRLVIDGCHGCDASQICGECIYTRAKHKGDLREYISAVCAENMKKIRELTQDSKK